MRALTSGAKGPNVFNCTTTPEDASLYHECVLEIPNFIVPRTPLNCRTGQCIDTLALSDGITLANGTVSALAVEYMGRPVDAALNAVIAAIPTMILVLMASILLLYFVLYIGALYRADGAADASCKADAVPFPSAAVPAMPVVDCLEFQISATARISSFALQRRLGNVRNRTKISIPGLGARGDVELGSAEARSAVAKLHVKEDEPNSWYILDKCTGEASSGTVTGIMGPSGCGKTTLLSTLSGAGHVSLKSLHVTGKVTWNGNPVHHGASIAFVPQMDSLIPTLTVREQLLFVARLKNPTMDVSGVQEKVTGVLEELGIDGIADQYVGGTSTLRGVSGGERRRCMIGTALVSSPRMIVLDEPLSGLDSYNALIVTSTLKSLANKGRVVLYSLHQPSDDIFTSLDVAIFMAHGRIVYQGPPSDCRYLLEGVGVYTSDAKGTRPLADAMLYALNEPTACQSLIGAGRDKPGIVRQNTLSQSSSFKHESPSLGLQASMVLYRTLVDILRNRSLLVLHVCIAIVAGLLAGGIFYDLGYDTVGVQGRYGGIFVSLCFLAFTSLTTVDLFIAERDIVTAEVSSGIYRDWVYCSCKILADGLLLRALPAVLYAVPYVAQTRRLAAAVAAATLTRLALLLSADSTGWLGSGMTPRAGSHSCSRSCSSLCASARSRSWSSTARGRRARPRSS